MKTCPCCKSQVFEDLDRCYECLRPFRYAPRTPRDAGAVAATAEPDADAWEPEPANATGEVSVVVVGAGSKPGMSKPHVPAVPEIAPVPQVPEVAGKAPGAVDRAEASPAQHLKAPAAVQDQPTREASNISGTSAGGDPGWDITVAPAGFPVFVKRVAPDGAAITIGRALDNDIILSDLHVSRHHARLFCRDGALWVRDCGSRNLTYLDGIPVVGQRQVEEGHELLVASATITAVRAGHAPGPRDDASPCSSNTSNTQNGPHAPTSPHSPSALQGSS